MFRRKTVISGMNADDAAAFKAHIDLANSERAAIWARNGTMIVTNALLINATNISPSLLRSLGCGTLGLCTCWLWFVMTRAGWSITHHHNACAKALWSHRPNNPFERRATAGDRDDILTSTKRLILLFAVLHFFFAGIPIWPTVATAISHLQPLLSTVTGDD